MDLQPLIAPVPLAQLKEELSRLEPILEKTSHGNFVVYFFEGSKSPALMQEVGRLREEAYRSHGAGTGRATDVDEFDMDPSLGFKQLMLWDPELECIVGGYRLLPGKDCKYSPEGQPVMPSSHIFHFSERFLKEYMPRTVELSRSYIATPFQRHAAEIRTIYALDAILEGVCAAIGLSGSQYIFGKVTFYPQYPVEAFQLVSSFFSKYWSSDLVEPVNRVPINENPEFSAILSNATAREDFRALKLALREKGVTLPPILNTYLNISSSFSYYGSAVNDEFAYATEMGLLVNTDDVIKARYQVLLKNPE